MNNPLELYPDPKSLLPHSGDACWIGKVEAFSEEACECLCEVQTKNSELKSLGAVPNYFALEYMAQTVGIYAGLSRRSKNLAPKVGFIIGVRSLNCIADKFALGEVLRIRAKKIWLDGTIGMFECSIFGTGNPQLLAQGTLSVYQMQD